jgi:hypothetical protein
LATIAIAGSLSACRAADAIASKQFGGIKAQAPAESEDQGDIKTAAEKAGFEYKYDKFQELEAFGPAIKVKGGTVGFLYGGYAGKSYDYLFGVTCDSIGYDDKAIFLIDGKRSSYEPIERKYRSFTAHLSPKEIREMSEAKEMAVQVGSFEYDFAAEDIAKIKTLIRFAGLHDGVKASSPNRGRE